MTDVTAEDQLPCQAQAQWSESDRLAALARYDILDTSIEDEFDDIAQLAADVLEAPIAVVNFIGSDRQCSLSVHSVDASWA